MPLGVYTFILNFMPGKKYISILMDYDNMNYAGANGSSSNAKPNGISDTLTQGLQFQKYLKISSKLYLIILEKYSWKPLGKRKFLRERF